MFDYQYRLWLIRYLVKIFAPPLVTTVAGLRLISWAYDIQLSSLFTTALFVVSPPLDNERKSRRVGINQAPLIEGKSWVNLDLADRLGNGLMHDYPGHTIDTLLDEAGVHTARMSLFGDQLLVTRDPEVVRYVLSSGFSNFRRAQDSSMALYSFLGKGIFTMGNELARSILANARPFFGISFTVFGDAIYSRTDPGVARTRISDLKAVSKNCEKVISLFTEKAKRNEASDIQDVFERFTMDTASVQANLHSVRRFSLPTALWAAQDFFNDPMPRPMKIIHGYLEPLAWKALDLKYQRQGKGEMLSDDGYETYAEHLAASTDDIVLIRDQLLNMMIAARDTSAIFLTCACYLLARHPDVMAHLRDEIVKCYGTSKLPTYEDMKRLKLLRVVLSETLRLFPPLSENLREMTSEGIIPTSDGSIFVPRQGLKVLICLGMDLAYNQASFVIIRLLQVFDRFTLAQEECAPLDTLPPKEWKSREGRQATEEFWPGQQLTMYIKRFGEQHQTQVAMQGSTRHLLWGTSRDFCQVRTLLSTADSGLTSFGMGGLNFHVGMSLLKDSTGAPGRERSDEPERQLIVLQAVAAMFGDWHLINLTSNEGLDLARYLVLVLTDGVLGISAETELVLLSPIVTSPLGLEFLLQPIMFDYQYRLWLVRYLVKVLAPPLVTTAAGLQFISWAYGVRLSSVPSSALFVVSPLVYWMIKGRLAQLRDERKTRQVGMKQAPLIEGKSWANLDLADRLGNGLMHDYPGQTIKTLLDEAGVHTARMSLFGDQLLITRDPQVVRYALNTGFSNFGRDPDLSMALHGLFGKGILTMENEPARSIRANARPFFARTRLSDLQAVSKNCDKVILLFTEMADRNEACDVQDVFERFTMDTGAEFLCGDAELNTLGRPLRRPRSQTGPEDSASDYLGFVEASIKVNIHAVRRFSLPAVLWAAQDFFHDPMARPMDVIHEYLEPFAREALDRKRQRQEKGQMLAEDGYETYAEHLAASTDDVILIRDQLLNMLMAARDTTAILLSCACYLLARHPDVMAGLRDEILQHYSTSKLPTYKDMKSLKLYH
ncbi:hypothetical protein FRB97_003625 [Tulasnella sp. 331]|nr:hypothetical protein FRB97_003625 [Tulasnella sp. 331]